MAPETKWTPNKRLTTKENRFVFEVVNNPKQSFTESAMRSYNTTSRVSAANIAQNLRKKPHIMAELAKYSSNAEANLIKLANVSTEYAMEGGRDGAAYASVAEKTNNSILDRLHGKSTQKVESTSVAVQLNVDLSGAS